MEAAAIMAIALANGGVSAQLFGLSCHLSQYMSSLPDVLVQRLHDTFLRRESLLTGKILLVLSRCWLSTQQLVLLRKIMPVTLPLL